MRIKSVNISCADYKELEKKYSDKELEEVLERIEKDNYPVQYAIGNIPFFNTIINVDERALIPRFATELLVLKLIDYIKKEDFKIKKIIDLCTGSGAIAIALKKNMPEFDIVGVDISSDAISLARENSLLNGLKVDFIELDILGNVDLKEKFSVIVSNPPYVKQDEYVSLNTKYEPSIALYPGLDDIVFYKKIIDDSKRIIDINGIIAFEIGSTQAKSIVDYAKLVYPNSKIIVEKDYEGFDRFIFIFLNKL